jgi:hypothetical protein
LRSPSAFFLADDVGDDFVEHVQYVVENIPDADVPAPRDFFEWN